MRNGATGWSSCETTRSWGGSRNGFMVFPSEQTEQTGSTQGTCHTFLERTAPHMDMCKSELNQKSTSSVVITDESFTSSWNQGDHNPYLIHVGPWIKSLNLLLPKHLEVNHWLRRLKNKCPKHEVNTGAALLWSSMRKTSNKKVIEILTNKLLNFHYHM